MIRNFDELCKAMAKCLHGKTPDQVKAEVADRQSETFIISRMVQRYMHAQAAAPTFGLIGVGAISFAEHRLQEFQRRIGRA